ncbi:hypothetical protein PENTCL1PPCAC_28905, partial [Pristionchus entomophagus]
QNYQDDKMTIIFSLAPWRENKNLFKISLNLFFFSYNAVLVHVTMSSVYRYALLCNATLRRMFEKTRRSLYALLFWACFFTYWLKTLNEILTDEVVVAEDIIVTIQKMFNVDLNKAGVVGNSIENISKSPLSGKMTFITVLGIVLLVISFCCGCAIHTTLQGDAISPKTKIIHKKALHLLMAQFALPLFFLHIPTFIFEVYSLLIQDTIPMFIKIYIRIFLTYYPVANAAFLTDDFRNFILSISVGECKVVAVDGPPP